jgi:hypothetical protein
MRLNLKLGAVIMTLLSACGALAVGCSSQTDDAETAGTRAAVTCISSGTCAAGQHCSTEDGVCNSTGMLTVCSGTCVAGAQ